MRLSLVAPSLYEIAPSSPNHDDPGFGAANTVSRRVRGRSGVSDHWQTLRQKTVVWWTCRAHIRPPITGRGRVRRRSLVISPSIVQAVDAGSYRHDRRSPADP